MPGGILGVALDWEWLPGLLLAVAVCGKVGRPQTGGCLAEGRGLPSRAGLAAELAC
jgi:hypothetical protein